MFENAVDNVKEPSHGSAEDEHLRFTPLRQAVSQGFGGRVMSHGSHGREEERLTQMGIADLAEFGAMPNRRARTPMHGRKAGVSSQFRGVIKAINGLDFSHQLGGGIRADARNGVNQVDLFLQIRMLADMVIDLPL